ncbi:MAG: four helix bundle protein [Candidatus Shapirobacteria bacterium]|nr:four helix bundle protein [Candidatus Shapirobacteria bacterium]
MIPAHSYKNLIVYQKAKNLTIDAIHYFATQKTNQTNNIAINQPIRALSSIGANIAEGYGRHYKKNYRQFISIARGSSFESDYWLEILTETNPLSKQRFQEFAAVNDELSKMLTVMMKKMEDKEST